MATKSKPVKSLKSPPPSAGAKSTKVAAGDAGNTFGLNLVIKRGRPLGKDGRRVRVLLMHTIGWSDSGSLATRTVRRDIADDPAGWQKYVEKHVMPAMQYLDPIDRDGVLIHNPFGCLPREDMQADQAVHAIESGLSLLVSQYANAIKRVSDRCEVITYLGNLPRDPDFMALAKDGDAEGYLQRLLNSYGPVLRGRTSVAFDVMNDVKQDNPAVKFMQLLRSLNVPCYIEPFPSKDDHHLFDVPALIMEDWFQKFFADDAVWPSWAMPRSRLIGEQIRVFNQYVPSDSTQQFINRQVAFVRDCWSNGYSAAIAGDVLTHSKASIDELVNAAT